LEGSIRGLDGDAFLSFGWMTQANYEQDRQCTEDGQNNGNDNIGIKLFVLAALKEY